MPGQSSARRTSAPPCGNLALACISPLLHVEMKPLTLNRTRAIEALPCALQAASFQHGRITVILARFAYYDGASGD